MPTQTYTITPAQFADYIAQLPAQGVTIKPTDNEHGQATYSNYVVGYAYNGTTLTLTGEDKPFISFPWSVVFGRISEHLT